MTCSIIHDNFQMFMEGTDVMMRLSLPSRNAPRDGFKQYYGSALQNPDLKRVELAAMLRDAERHQPIRGRNSQMKSFMNAYTTQCANNNE